MGKAMDNVSTVVQAAWSSALSALRQNIPLAIIAIVSWAGLNELSHLLPLPTRHFTDVHGHVHSVLNVSAFLLFILDASISALQSLAMAPFLVSVHLRVLMCEPGNIWKKPARLISFAASYFVLTLFTHDLPASLHQISPLFTIILVPFYWVGIRLALVYPAVVLGMPNPLRDSWERTRGHWWFISVAFFLALAPIRFITPFIAIVAAKLMPEFTRLYVAIFIVFTAYILILSVAAALASKLFRKFGAMPAQT